MINEVLVSVTVPQQIKSTVTNWESSSGSMVCVNQVVEATRRRAALGSELANNVSGHWRLTTDIA